MPEVSSRFVSALQDNFMLDIYLAPHVKTLYGQIRNRALVQVSGYLSVSQSISEVVNQ